MLQMLQETNYILISEALVMQLHARLATRRDSQRFGNLFLLPTLLAQLPNPQASTFLSICSIL